MTGFEPCPLCGGRDVDIHLGCPEAKARCRCGFTVSIEVKHRETPAADTLDALAKAWNRRADNSHALSKTVKDVAKAWGDVTGGDDDDSDDVEPGVPWDDGEDDRVPDDARSASEDSVCPMCRENRLVNWTITLKDDAGNTLHPCRICPKCARGILLQLSGLGSLCNPDPVPYRRGRIPPAGPYWERDDGFRTWPYPMYDDRGDAL